jgi:hypothetical protein
VQRYTRALEYLFPQDFPDDAAAQRECSLVAQDLARKKPCSRSERVIVTREDGTAIHEAYLKIAALLT